ncbi:AbrB/MazE/SpoVT family DNA-binding domain-containing protein [Methylohalobius crimeensis]|uniref:AbrB/MazE/SpoVT family DNA-binding domain-containing protein n=1 Tax=Methylohalobius crimeensis TaxID=244365 RepID=UPI0003B4F064|nr:AbrB/MazE/SpoVT family DNA-binding domain-containing protein [Methylohalobius crimeensis]
MTTDESRSEVHIDIEGRVVVPTHLLRALNLKPGDRLMVRKVGDSFMFERRETIENRLWKMFSQIPKGISMVDELIAERRAEAWHEVAE